MYSRQDRLNSDFSFTATKPKTIWDGKEHLKTVAESYCKKNKIKLNLDKVSYGDLAKEPFTIMSQTKAWKKAEKDHKKKMYSGYGYSWLNFGLDGFNDDDIEDIEPIFLE